MYLKTVTEVIASREYQNSDGGTVTILMGKPELFPDGEGIDGFYYCPFQILGIGQDLVMHSSGIDSIQAIVGAMKMIGARLYNCNLVTQGKLKWIGELDGDKLGFPEPK